MPISPEQFEAMIAAGLTPAQIAAMIAPAGAAAAQPLSFAAPAGDPLLAGIRRAPPPTQAGQSFVDDNGQFDGQYRVRVKSVDIDVKEKGKILRTIVTVLASSNMHVSVGSDREYALFLWNPPALADAQGWLQQLSDAKGNVGQFSDQFYHDATGEKNACAGLEFDLSVFTKAQKQNKSKTFTHLRFSTPSGASIVAASAPMSAPVASAAIPPKPAGWPDSLAWPPNAA